MATRWRAPAFLHRGHRSSPSRGCAQTAHRMPDVPTPPAGANIGNKQGRARPAWQWLAGGDSSSRRAPTGSAALRDGSMHSSCAARRAGIARTTLRHDANAKRAHACSRRRQAARPVRTSKCCSLFSLKAARHWNCHSGGSSQTRNPQAQHGNVLSLVNGLCSLSTHHGSRAIFGTHEPPGFFAVRRHDFCSNCKSYTYQRHVTEGRRLGEREIG